MFVDDVVTGDLPSRCVYTGAPTNRVMRFEHQVSSRWWMWLFVFFGPIAWLILAVVALVVKAEHLTVRLPVSRAAADRFRRLRWRCVEAVAAGVMSLVMAAALEPFREILIGGGLVAFAAAVVIRARIAFMLVDIELDASRRWVHLGNVHPDFATAVDDARRDSRDRDALR